MTDSVIKNATHDTYGKLVLERSDEVPVLVDFWAEWCGPCKAVAPVLEELAGKYAGKLDVVKVDVDAEGAAAQEHQVFSIPTLVLFSKGSEVGRQVGAMDLQAYEKFVEPFLPKSG